MTEDSFDIDWSRQSEDSKLELGSLMMCVGVTGGFLLGLACFGIHP